MTVSCSTIWREKNKIKQKCFGKVICKLYGKAAHSESTIAPPPFGGRASTCTEACPPAVTPSYHAA